MRQSTEPEKNTWLARCRYPICDRVKISCPVCKRPGHVTLHKTNIQGHQELDHNYPVRIVIQHSHFLENIDAGRNMPCDTNLIEWIDESEIKSSWQLPNETRLLVIDGIEQRYLNDRKITVATPPK